MDNHPYRISFRETDEYATLIDEVSGRWVTQHLPVCELNPDEDGIIRTSCGSFKLRYIDRSGSGELVPKLVNAAVLELPIYAELSHA